MDYKYPAEAEGKSLYVVFRTADGSLKAFAARYDKAGGKLVFETDLLGEFVVVVFDYEGEAFTAAFYEALAKLAVVQKLR